MPVTLLSGGAAQGLIAALAPRFKAETGHDIAGSFGAVGAMRDELLAGAAADLLLLTSTMIAELVRHGHAVAASVADVGKVSTALAVRAGAPVPALATGQQLRQALDAAAAIYFPDPERATAGIHFAKVMAAIGISPTALAAKARPYANGASAMQALAGSAATPAIGCTQATEILSTPGVQLVAPLPAPFSLATVYTAAVSTTARLPAEAQALIGLITDPRTAGVRLSAGFEPLG